MYTNDAFRTWLVEELERRGWTQADLAAASNMSPSLISKIIRGDRNIGFDSAVALARGLNIPTETLLFHAGLLDEDPEPDPSMRELLFLFDQLSDEDREVILTMLRGYARERIKSLLPKPAKSLPTS